MLTHTHVFISRKICNKKLYDTLWNIITIFSILFLPYLFSFFTCEMPVNKTIDCQKGICVPFLSFCFFVLEIHFSTCPYAAYVKAALQSASEDKWLAVLIASCLPHEPAARRAVIMEGVGTVHTLLLPLTVWVQYQLVLKCAARLQKGLD